MALTLRQEVSSRQLTADTPDLKLTDNSLTKNTLTLADTKQDCQLKSSEFESVPRGCSEELATLAKARTATSEKTVGAEPFDCSVVQSSFFQVSWSLLSSRMDFAEFEAVRRIRGLVKRERSLQLAQVASCSANCLASAIHAQTSNGDDSFAFAHAVLIIRDPHVISLTGQKYDLWRTGWSINVRILGRGKIM